MRVTPERNRKFIECGETIGFIADDLESGVAITATLAGQDVIMRKNAATMGTGTAQIKAPALWALFEHRVSPRPAR